MRKKGVGVMVLKMVKTVEKIVMAVVVKIEHKMVVAKGCLAARDHPSYIKMWLCGSGDYYSNGGETSGDCTEVVVMKQIGCSGSDDDGDDLWLCE